MQYQAEEEYLRAMHKSGWRFVKVSGMCIYSFEKCKSQDVVYKLDYNKDGIVHKNEYIQMFNDCGWEYMQDYLGYSYFRKPASDESGSDDIFCDDESRLQMVSRVAKGRLLPIMILYFAIVSQFILSLHSRNYILANVYAVILVIYAAIFACFGIQYLIFRKKMK